GYGVQVSRWAAAGRAASGVSSRPRHSILLGEHVRGKEKTAAAGGRAHPTAGGLVYPFMGLRSCIDGIVGLSLGGRVERGTEQSDCATLVGIATARALLIKRGLRSGRVWKRMPGCVEKPFVQSVQFRAIVGATPAT